MAHRGSEAYSWRAPRITLDEKTDKVVKLYNANKPDRPLITESLNVSASGLAFVVDAEFAPPLGEMIIVEFYIPGNQLVRWYARVNRIEFPDEGQWKLKPYKVNVAVVFKNLPMQIRKQIHNAVMHQIRSAEVQNQAHEQVARSEKWNRLLANLPHMMVWMASLAVIVAIFFVITKPSKTYDVDHPGIWGERFKTPSSATDPAAAPKAEDK